ncbi:MAG: rRNA maturation RNase YbeY [Pseudomonadota bacterium]
MIEEAAWVDLERLAKSACPAALKAVDLDADRYSVSILGCDDDRIAGLNAEFRGKPTPTNVLSWPSSDWHPPAPPKPGELGDIAIAHGICAREAAEQGKTLDDHLTHLLIHATLHLIGYDHETDADAAIMESLETAALATLGIGDPY